MTIIVHHLENSRSQRVLWMLEELGLPHEIKRYERNTKTMLAPPELKAVHPLGKSPVIEDTDDGGRVVAETGAIVEYLVEKADGRLGPPPHRDDALRYRFWAALCRGLADAAAARQAGPHPRTDLRQDGAEAHPGR